MSVKENKEIIQRYLHEGYGLGNVNLVDELVSETFRDRPLHTQPVQVYEGETDFESEKEGIKDNEHAFPDHRLTVHWMVAEGDSVVVSFTDEGTHKGGLWRMPPTGKRVKTVHIVKFRLAGGKIVEAQYLWDRLGFWQQLGVLAETQEILDKAGINQMPMVYDQPNA